MRHVVAQLLLPVSYLGSVACHRADKIASFIASQVNYFAAKAATPSATAVVSARPPQLDISLKPLKRLTPSRQIFPDPPLRATDIVKKIALCANVNELAALHAKFDCASPELFICELIKLLSLKHEGLLDTDEEVLKSVQCRISASFSNLLHLFNARQIGFSIWALGRLKAIEIENSIIDRSLLILLDANLKSLEGYGGSTLCQTILGLSLLKYKNRNTWNRLTEEMLSAPLQGVKKETLSELSAAITALQIDCEEDLVGRLSKHVSESIDARLSAGS